MDENLIIEVISNNCECNNISINCNENKFICGGLRLKQDCIFEVKPPGSNNKYKIYASFTCGTGDQ